MANNNPFMNAPGMGGIGGAGSMMGGRGGTEASPMPGSSVPMGSDNFEIDLSEIQSGFTIPDGLYKVKCVEVEQTVSKGGNPMFAWTFEVSAGPQAGFQSKVFTALTPAAMWKVAETVEALGVGQTGQVVKFRRSDVLNKECGAMFETSEYNGQTRSQISHLMSIKEMNEALAK